MASALTAAQNADAPETTQRKKSPQLFYDMTQTRLRDSPKSTEVGNQKLYANNLVLDRSKLRNLPTNVQHPAYTKKQRLSTNDKQSKHSESAKKHQILIVSNLPRHSFV